MNKQFIMTAPLRPTAESLVEILPESRSFPGANACHEEFVADLSKPSVGLSGCLSLIKSSPTGNWALKALVRAGEWGTRAASIQVTGGIRIANATTLPQHSSGRLYSHYQWTEILDFNGRQLSPGESFAAETPFDDCLVKAGAGGYQHSQFGLRVRPHSLESPPRAIVVVVLRFWLKETRFFKIHRDLHTLVGMCLLRPTTIRVANRTVGVRRMDTFDYAQRAALKQLDEINAPAFVEHWVGQPFDLDGGLWPGCDNQPPGW